jgi:hypothetical protein
MQIAVYVWEIRKATKAGALSRKALEKALLELETLRKRVKLSLQPKNKQSERNLAATLESLIDMTENDILSYLASLPSGLYDLPQFAQEA